MFHKLFKPRAHYVFDYKPRYYDERKERLEQLENTHHGTGKNDPHISGIKLSKNQLRNEWIKNKKSAADKRTNIRLALIVAFLAGLAAYFFDLHSLF